VWRHVAEQPDGNVIDSHRGAAVEMVASNPELLPGEVRHLALLPQPSPFSPLLHKGLADESLLQLWLPAPRFAVMSAGGVLELTRRRPIDVLRVRLIATRTPHTFDSRMVVLHHLSPAWWQGCQHGAMVFSVFSKR
jgi:hypothetical protein